MKTTGAAFALTLARNVDVIAGESIVRCHAALGFDDTDVEKGPDGSPVAFRMWRAGLNRTDHGDHVLTVQSVKQLLTSQATRGNRFSIDVDHMSLDNQAPPENHKAVGWFDIEERDGDLWAVNVQWTDAVRAGLAKDPPEWRYFSPAYDTKKSSGEIVRLLNLALTNNPATHHVTALASTAGCGEEKTAMADDNDKKEESLAAMLAAYDEEKDEEKRTAMKAAIKAKFKAAFGDDDGDKKKDAPPPEKKETKADAPPPDKKETKADEDEANEEKIAASIADKALVDFESKRKAREDKAEVDRILASLPAGDRELCKDMNLEQVKRVATRLNPEVLSQRAAAGNVQHTRGADQTSRHQASMLPSTEREALDASMGLVHRDGWFVKEEGTTLEFNPWASRDDVDRTLASIKKERANGAKRDGDAINRVLANQKGAA